MNVTSKYSYVTSLGNTLTVIIVGHISDNYGYVSSCDQGIQMETPFGMA